MMKILPAFASLTTAGILSLGALTLSGTAASAHETYTRCDRDGDTCRVIRCDDDGDDCRTVRSYNPGYRYRDDYDRYDRWGCDRDGDDCHRMSYQPGLEFDWRFR